MIHVDGLLYHSCVVTCDASTEPAVLEGKDNYFDERHYTDTAYSDSLILQAKT